MFGYLLLGATWLVLKTEGALQEWARRMARIGLAGVVAFIAMVSIWTPFLDGTDRRTLVRLAQRRVPRAGPRRYRGSSPGGYGARSHAVASSHRSRRRWDSSECATSGSAISIFPYIVPPSITLWDAAAAPQSQAFLLLGTLFLLPVILMYTGWSYWVFRGKVRADAGYH